MNNTGKPLYNKLEGTKRIYYKDVFIIEIIIDISEEKRLNLDFGFYVY